MRLKVGPKVGQVGPKVGQADPSLDALADVPGATAFWGTGAVWTGSGVAGIIERTR